MKLLLILPFALTVILGAVLPFLKIKHRRTKIFYTAASLIINLLLTLTAVLFVPEDARLTVWRMSEELSIAFSLDTLGRFFAVTASAIWLAVGIFSFVYMSHEEREQTYYGYYLITIGTISGLFFSANLLTMYLCFEAVTLCALPLVLHNLKRESINAGLKYLFYSIGGAFLGLAAIFYAFHYCASDSFRAGGTLNSAVAAGNTNVLLTVLFLALIGFGAKAGMFPLHAWLPTAHPAAPSPASAVLSGIITKAGIFAVIRLVFYVYGADFIRGTWVQYAWIILALITVFMGSLMAYMEPVLKKRLAYSTVSQVSYVLLGLAVLTVNGFEGALMHVTAHALIKDGLFLAAGAIIFKTGKTRVDELNGIGRKMPVTMWCFTIFGAALVGIPPASAFISKWYLAQGALESGLGVLTWIIPLVLLLSALLTAGYLFPISIKGFFGKSNFANENGVTTYSEVPRVMTAVLIIFAAAALIIGIYPNGLVAVFEKIAQSII